ncbi:MAG: LysR family transcriptional regulator [Polyangiales bacterium]
MNLGSVDLNLLVVLDALLAERSVTRAARKLGLSQPATSSALNRLRAHFGDPLFVRTSAGIEPTARALSVERHLRAALDAVRATLAEPRPFDPATAKKAFRMSVPDSFAVQLLPPALERMEREAPGVDLILKPFAADAERADQLLLEGELDAIVTRDETPRAGLQQRLLWKEKFVCVLRRGHPMATKRAFTLEHWLSLRHVLVAPRGTVGSLVDDTLARLGHTRRVALLVPQFLMAPEIVARTDLAWTAPASVARAMEATHGLVIKPVPIELEGFSLFLRWHDRFDRDPAHRWLRALVADAAQKAKSRS